MSELSDSWEPPTWPLPQRAGEPAEPRSTGEGSPAASESITTIALTHISDVPMPGVLPAHDTPMSGESGPDAEPGARGKVAADRVALRRLALALGGAGAVVALLVSARVLRSPGEPTHSEAQVVDERGSGPASAASDLELGAQPPRSITEAVVLPTPPVDSSATPTPAAPSEANVVKTTPTRVDAVPSGLAARKTTSSPRPALRSPPTKTAVPDDGRDELIVPPVRSPPTKAHVPDDGRDELNLPPVTR